MAITRTETQVAWGTAGNETSLTASGGNDTSDAITLDATCVAAAITCKADNSATTPAAGDNVEFWLLASAGDPDGASADEYPTNENDGQFLCLADTNAIDPAIITVSIPPVPQKIQIYAINNGASSITASATIEEMRAA